MRIEGQKHLGSGSVIALIMMLCFFPPFTTDMFLSDLPNMGEELGAGASVMNMVLYGFMLSLAVSILVFGPITDKVGRRPVLVFALIEYIAASLLGSQAQDVYILIAFRVLQGIGAGACMTVSTALIKDCFEGPTMKHVLNISAVLGVIAPIVAPILGSWVISVSDWRMTLVVPTLLGFVCLAISLLLTETVPDDEREGASVRGNFRETAAILGDRAFAVFLLMMTVFNGCFMAYLSVSSYIYEGYFGVSSMQYSLFLAAALIGGTVLMIPVNRIGARMGNVRSLGMYLAIMLLSAVLMFSFGDAGKYEFLIAFLPCIVVTTAIRPFGMALVLGSRDGDNGLVSALINFMMFVTGVFGMVCSTMFDDYVLGLGVIMVAASAIYTVLWACLKRLGYSRVRTLGARRGCPGGAPPGRVHILDSMPRLTASRTSDDGYAPPDLFITMPMMRLAAFSFRL